MKTQATRGLTREERRQRRMLLTNMEKLEAARRWLGNRWCLHPEHRTGGAAS